MGAKMGVACLAVVVCLVAEAQADAFPEGGIGITAEADSVGSTEDLDPGCPIWHLGHYYSDYDLFSLTFDPWADLDIDLLVHEDFAALPSLDPVTTLEVELLVKALDDTFDNLFGWDETDLGLTFQGFNRCYPEFPYDPNGAAYHFLLWSCPAFTDSSQLSIMPLRHTASSRS